MTFSQIISLVISILSFLGVGSIFTWFWKDRLEKKKAESEEAKKRVRNENDKHFLELAETVAAPIITEIAEIKNELAADKRATVASLRNEMYNLWQKCKEQRYATVTEKANWQELYDAYKELGGNHFREYVNQWRSGMENLPLPEED